MNSIADLRSAAFGESGPQSRQIFLLSLVAGIIAALCVIYRQTLAGMVTIWWRSETFNHCFLILPLAAYLVYARRAELRSIKVAPFPPGLALLSLIGVIWLAGWGAAANVVEQFAVVMMIPAAVFCLFGPRMAAQLAGPLAYLLFAVPFGEIFMEPLREVTATFIVTGLQISGISVVRSGMQLSTTVGDFAVERACSGLRYLIASFALGTLFAMLFLKSWRRRALFIAISLVVPVLANGIRAFLIVVLAHASGLRIATGVDHIIYGWVFFGIVMALVFAFGAKMSRTEEAEGGVAGSATTESSVPTLERKPVLVMFVLVVAIMSIAPAIASIIESREANLTVRQPTLSALNRDRGLVPTTSDWQPTFPGKAGSQAVRVERSDGPPIDIAIGWYGEPKEGSRLITYHNRVVDKTIWREREGGTTNVELADGKRIPFVTSALESVEGRRQRLNWYVYLIGTHVVANDYQGKLVESWTRVVSPGSPAWSIVFSIEVQPSDANSQAALERFVRENFYRVIESATQNPQQQANP